MSGWAIYDISNKSYKLHYFLIILIVIQYLVWTVIRYTIQVKLISPGLHTIQLLHLLYLLIIFIIFYSVK